MERALLPRLMALHGRALRQAKSLEGAAGWYAGCARIHRYLGKPSLALEQLNLAASALGPRDHGLRLELTWAFAELGYHQPAREVLEQSGLVRTPLDVCGARSAPGQSRVCIWLLARRGPAGESCLQAVQGASRRCGLRPCAPTPGRHVGRVRGRRRALNHLAAAVEMFEAAEDGGRAPGPHAHGQAPREQGGHRGCGAPPRADDREGQGSRRHRGHGRGSPDARHRSIAEGPAPCACSLNPRVGTDEASGAVSDPGTPPVLPGRAMPGRGGGAVAIAPRSAADHGPSPAVAAPAGWAGCGDANGRHQAIRGLCSE